MPKASSFSTETLQSNRFLMFDSRTCDLISVEEASELLNQLMEANAYVQQCYVDAFLHDKHVSREIGTHTTAAQREPFLEVTNLPESWKSHTEYNRSNIDEACRTLKTWQERYNIADLITKNPGITNEEVIEKLGYSVKNSLIENIRHSGRLPSAPEIEKVRLLLGIDGNIVKKLCPNGVWLHNVHITTRTVDIFVPIAERQYENLGKIVKIGAPIIRTDGYNHYTFDFMIKSRRKTPTLQPNYLGVDPKLNGGFAAALINGENKQISGYIQPSVQVQRCQIKIDHISNDIGLKRKRKRNFLARRTPNQRKIDILDVQIAKDRKKLEKVKEDLDWQAACDLAELARKFFANICYENVKCNTGGRLHFRSTQKRAKLKQVAAKRGCTVIDVNAAYTSQDCPKCGNRAKKKLSQRVHKCDKCDLKCDRDYASAVNMAERGMKNKDVRWTEAIEAKKQIVRRRKKTLGNQTGKTADAQNSGSRGLGEVSQAKRPTYYWGSSARQSTTIEDYDGSLVALEYDKLYLVGISSAIELIPGKQKTSTRAVGTQTNNTTSTNCDKSPRH